MLDAGNQTQVGRIQGKSILPAVVLLLLPWLIILHDVIISNAESMTLFSLWNENFNEILLYSELLLLSVILKEMNSFLFFISGRTIIWKQVSV